jgi:hypothetical protein
MPILQLRHQCTYPAQIAPKVTNEHNKPASGTQGSTDALLLSPGDRQVLAGLERPGGAGRTNRASRPWRILRSRASRQDDHRDGSRNGHDLASRAQLALRDHKDQSARRDRREMRVAKAQSDPPSCR